jgi:hypothetical protein
LQKPAQDQDLAIEFHLKFLTLAWPPANSAENGVHERTGCTRIMPLFPCTGCARVLLMKRRETNQTSLTRVRRILDQLRGVRGLDEDELLQHALFFSKSPDERCRLSLQAARSALSLRRSAKRK